MLRKEKKKGGGEIAYLSIFEIRPLLVFLAPVLFQQDTGSGCKTVVEAAGSRLEYGRPSYKHQ